MQQSVRGRSRTRAVLAVAGAAALALSAALAAPSAMAAPQEFPDVGEIVSSQNMKQLSNLPKQGPLAGEDNLGTDIAFTGDHAVVGNYAGFTIYDIQNPKRPKQVSQVFCPGSQNDVSVSGDRLYLSTDSSRSDDSCRSEAMPASKKEAWEGIKVFDISDLTAPRYVAAVETKCGSHTHTLVPDKRGKNDFLYVSSYSPAPDYPDCKPPHDQISIVQVPKANPAAAKLSAEPRLFPRGGNPGIPGDFPDQYVVPTSGCHDITVFPSKDLAAGACMGDGVLMDISDRQRPKVIERTQDDDNFAFWHSATFNNRGDKVVFTDELGGGGAATCNQKVGATRGADGIYDIVGKGANRKLEFRSYFKIDREQAKTENCVAHNGSLLPVKGRDIMVQAWYQGGISVLDFTNSSRPREIGYWDRGPFSATEEVTAGPWSAYYYNGHIISSDIQKGLDVIRINDPRTNSAKKVRMDELNVQTQGRY